MVFIFWLQQEEKEGRKNFSGVLIYL